MCTNRHRFSFQLLFRITVLGCLLLVVGCVQRRAPAPLDVSQDARIKGEVLARLQEEPEIEAENVRVEVRGRTVLLHGSVRGLAAWRCLIRNAELVEGVSGVVDYLILERGPREVACRAPRRLPGARVAGS